MKATLRKLLASRLLRRIGLTKVVFRAYEIYQTRRADEAGETGGFPLPPARLRMLVAGTADSDWFLTAGRDTATIIAECVSRGGRSLDEMEAVLDFGCGCGRVVRHLPALTSARVFGSDYNPELVAWVRDNLPQVTAVENGLEPPLDFEDRSFDLVYAMSVFTHLTEELQHRWVAELARVLKPGGLLVFTTHGGCFLDRLGPAEKERFRAMEVVVQFDEMEGSNWCAAFHPEGYVSERLLGPTFALRDFRPGLRGSVMQQDSWTAERLVDLPAGPAR